MASLTREKLLWVLVGASIAIHLCLASFALPAYDFAPYYWAGHVAMSGQLDLLYSVEAQESSDANWANLPYAYSPGFAYFMAPWTLLEPQQAKRVWLIVQLMALVLAVVYWHRQVLRFEWPQAQVVLLGWLLSGVFFSNQLYGQVNALLVLLVALAVGLSTGQKTEWIAGILWGLSLYTKPLPVVLTLVWWRKPRVLAGATLSFGLPHLVIGWRHLATFVTSAVGLIEQHGAWYLPWNASLYGALRSIMQDPLWVYAPLSVVGLVVTVLALRRLSSDIERASLALSFVLLFSTMLQAHHLLLGLIPLGLLIKGWANGTIRSVLVCCCLVAASLAMLFHPFVSLLTYLSWVGLVASSALFLGLVAYAYAPRIVGRPQVVEHA